MQAHPRLHLLKHTFLSGPWAATFRYTALQVHCNGFCPLNQVITIWEICLALTCGCVVPCRKIWMQSSKTSTPDYGIRLQVRWNIAYRDIVIVCKQLMYFFPTRASGLDRWLPLHLTLSSPFTPSYSLCRFRTDIRDIADNQFFWSLNPVGNPLNMHMTTAAG